MKDRHAIPWLVGVAAALVYLARPSSFYNFDGVACAIAVDLRDVGHLAHGNHLLYGLAGLGFHELWKLAGYGGPSILPLSVLCSLLGAAGAGVFCALLLDLGFSRGRAAACAAGLALSQAYWFWSLEAQVYPIGNLFALLAFREALKDDARGARVGIWHGLAFLGHVGPAMLAPALVLTLAAARKPHRELARWLAAAAAVALAGYAVGALCVRPPDWATARSWLLGSAALTLDRSVRWYGGYSLANVEEWLRMSARIFAEPEGLSGAARLGAWALGLSGAGAALWGARASLGHGRRLAGAAALVWLAGYFVLFSTWQPFTPVYRISDLYPLWLLAAFALPCAAAVALAAALGAFNLVFTILPKTDAANNAPLRETRWVSERTPETSWVVVTGMGQVYAPYFGHRRPFNTKYFEGKPDLLAHRLDELRDAGEGVYVTSATLEQAAGADWADALRRYGLTEEARLGELVLFKAAGAAKKGSRGARAGKG